MTNKSDYAGMRARVRAMTTDELAAAVKARLWRTVEASPQAPPAPDPPPNTGSTVAAPQPAPGRVTKPAETMTDAEFRTALKNREWRTGHEATENR